MMIYVYWISLILIVYTFIGYPISLEMLYKLKKKKNILQDEKFEPNISLIIAAHNEEKSIETKLKNILELNYPKEKIQIIIASDNSNDNTEKIVKNFIKRNKLENFVLYCVKKRQGKTNAQNEAVKIATGNILFFSDANSIWDLNSLKKIIRNFKDEKVAYVCGKLIYVNSLENITSNAEDTYWNYDLKMREIESNFNSITAGNGAIYAIKKEDYIDINPIECHDGSYPTLMVLKDKRAIYEKEAIAYEKAGENSSDEYSRKVRMGRTILTLKYSNFSKYNPFKTGLYSYFYFCHRYLRYSLYNLHILLFVSNIYIYKLSLFYKLSFIGQVLFYSLAIIGIFIKTKFKIIYYPYYYVMTIFAQLVAVKRSLLGQNKPFWEKAQSTR